MEFRPIGTVANGFIEDRGRDWTKVVSEVRLAERFALALEGMSMTSALMLGPWIGGALVDVLPLGAIGVGAPYLAMMAGYAVALALLSRLASPVQQTVPLAVRLSGTWE